jgi:hypothetical protein
MFILLMAFVAARPARAQFSLESPHAKATPPTAATAPAPAPTPAPIPPPLPPLATDAPAALRIVLAGLDARYTLRVTVFSREQRTGCPVRVAADTLWLEGGQPLALADIARIEQQQSGFREGAQWAGLTGTVIGGLIGGWLGAQASGLGDDDGSPTFEAIAVGASLGMVMLGMPAALIGGGVGALAENWTTLYPPGLVTTPPPPADDDRPAVDRERRRTRSHARLLLESGWSTGSADRLESAGLAFSAALLTRLSPTFEYGPAFSFHALDTVVDIPPRTTSNTMTTVPPVASMGVDFRCQSSAPGARPWLDGGLGLVLSNDMHIGAHLGCGYRVRDAHGRDYGVFVRRQVPLVKQVDAIGGFWTLGAGFTFGL